MSGYIRALESMRAGDIEIQVPEDEGAMWGQPILEQFRTRPRYLVFCGIPAPSIARQALADREAVTLLEKKLEKANAKIKRMQNAIQALLNSTE